MRAAGPLVNKASPKKNPDIIAVLYPKFACRIISVLN